MLSGGRQPPSLFSAQRERDREIVIERPSPCMQIKRGMKEKKRANVSKKKNKIKRETPFPIRLFLLEILRHKIYGISNPARMFQVAVRFRSRRAHPPSYLYDLWL